MENDNKPERDGDTQTNASRNKIILLVVVAVVVLLLLALFFYLRGPGVEPEELTLAPPAPAVAPRPAPVAPPPAEKPGVELPPAPKPLPPLSESDTVVLEELGEIPEGERLVPLLVRDELIRKLVRAVHVVATDGTVVHEYRPVTPPSGSILVEKTEVIADEEVNQHFRLLKENYRRYDPYVSQLATMDPDALIALYRRYQPLLEQAYKEQGVNDGSFHRQLLNAIDHLLVAPVTDEELILVRPRVFYQYEDPALERLPDAHKLMLRMGPKNAQSVKASLRRLRTRLVEMNN